MGSQHGDTQARPTLGGDFFDRALERQPTVALGDLTVDQELHGRQENRGRAGIAGGTHDRV
ncbi:hypothetical protein, partial [Nocardia cyriacigeorgica]|uniref:hypothetical protein n=1 Tax=Nocardia cyriacigeorgica TaxID=135487 RepID=UPI0024537B3C